ncbi:MAG TPA: hypothetical protein VH814_16125 [Steroidobacteraceae bacterium]|jgi:hypothetical protein
MWATALSIITLASTLVVCSYVAKGARKLEAGLGALLEQQRERGRCVERHLAQARQSLTELEQS